MIQTTVEQNQLDIKWIGCDSAFGYDHEFLRSLSKQVHYFAAVRESELVFLERPTMTVQINKKKARRPFKQALLNFSSFTVKEVTQTNKAYPWVKRQIAERAKGTIYAQVKCIDDVACHSITRYDNYVTPEEDV